MREWWQAGAKAWRGGWIGLGLVAALLIGAPGVRAQESPSSAPGTASGSGSVGSLPPSIPVKRDNVAGGSDDADGRWWIAAVFIAGLAGWGIVAVRRKSAGQAAAPAWLTRWTGLPETAAQREIRRIASTRLTPRHSLHVVEWNGRQLLLGCTDQSVQLLSEAPATPPSEVRS